MIGNGKSGQAEMGIMTGGSTRRIGFFKGLGSVFFFRAMKKKPKGWLGFLLGMKFPTQLYRDYNKPLINYKDP